MSRILLRLISGAICGSRIGRVSLRLNLRRGLKVGKDHAMGVSRVVLSKDDPQALEVIARGIVPDGEPTVHIWNVAQRILNGLVSYENQELEYLDLMTADEGRVYL